MTTKPKPQRFSHPAMKTVFEIHLITDDAVLAKNVALDCWQRLDAIEASLNRHLPGSEVWQINHLTSGQSLIVGDDCYQCLRLAQSLVEPTGGLFDVSLGRLIEHRKTSAEGPLPELTGQLTLDPDLPQVHCLESGREIDLGGIGKGYALDEIARLCREWGISGGLVRAGASTQLAFGKTPWRITLRNDEHSHDVRLFNRALSASGTAIQGSHIVSPLGTETPYARQRVWVLANSAAVADAFSTAALLSPDLGQLNLEAMKIEVITADHNGFQTGPQKK
jgi:thiamine biosynthesis lipoprotein